MSINPGDITNPVASIIFFASGSEPCEIISIESSLIPTDAK